MKIHIRTSQLSDIDAMVSLVNCENLWQSVGHELIEETKTAAKVKGAKQILVVCWAHDYPKRKFLSEQNLQVASEWFVGGIV